MNLVKKIFGEIHLWLGVIGGIILFVVCLTGTILAFEEDVIEIINKEYRLTVSDNRHSIYEIKSFVEHQKNVEVVDVFYREDNKEGYPISIGYIDKKKKQRRPDRISLNPYTLEEVEESEFLKGHHFFETIAVLHRWLLLDKKIGRPIVGASTIVFIVLCISGMVLWLPKKMKRWSAWRKNLTIKWNGKWKRINYDVHNTLGFYALFPMLIMAFSGLIWSYGWYYEGLEKVLGDKLGKQRFEKTIVLPHNKSFDESVKPIESLVTKMNSHIEEPASYVRVNFPQSEKHTLMIRRKSNGFFSYDASDKFQFNPYTGEIVEIDLFKNWTVNQKIAALIRAIHIGSVYGTFSKIIYFISALIATSLPVTGVIIWINKLKKKRKRKQKPIKLFSMI
ncbi:PepSY-associated TM helix domain-containing protein [Aquimarina sediminis]|uniref:PepSY-associated TM helix domain-containing protein n=1 Tax=Aquimarina sediminis TaxID=2070536 RepID=UPI0013E8BE45|nr:PepSY-associated TM helix domain-containing protein [Aquimarina sediminis]